MITQHVVSFGDEITLTRLPAGRTEGYVWLSFVAMGAGIGTWDVHEHVRLSWIDGTPGAVVATDGGGGDGPHHYLMEVRDAGFGRLIISYLEDDEIIDHEVIELPHQPDPARHS